MIVLGIFQLKRRKIPVCDLFLSKKQISAMAKEEFEFRKFEKSFAYLDKLIREWYVSLYEKCKESYCLAISRKAPRLLDWCQETYSDMKGVRAISELALPFMNDMVRDKECVLVDEAIYHGTTFRNVLSLSENVFSKVTAMPLVCTIEAMLSENINSHLKRWHIIDDNDCPFFINSVISKFLTIGKPYDIEYPLFYIDLDEKITERQIQDFLEKLAQTEAIKRGLDKEKECIYYPTKIYSREEEQYYTSFTYLSEYLYTQYNERSKPEFSKIRIQYKGNRLCIVSMSPYVISEEDLTWDNPMLGGDLGRVWNLLYTAAEDWKNSVDDECRYQVNKSLVVMTNYLLSFANFLYLKDSILESLPVVGKTFSLKLSDLTYLVGPELDSSLKSSLDNLLNVSYPLSYDVQPSPLSSGIVYHEIPSKYRDDYALSLSLDNLSTSDFTVSSMMSNMFSAMHWKIEIPSRQERSMDNFKRLHFGESYRSIQERFGIHYTDDVKLRKEIHEALDLRITSGSAVPNYLRQSGIFSDHYWVRMFRSGENEDFYKDQVLRQLVSVFKAFLKFNKGGFIHLYGLEFILALIAYKENHYNKENSKCRYLFGAPLEVRFSKDMYKTYIRLSEDKTISLINYAIDSHIFSLDEHNLLQLEDNYYARKLTYGTIWSNEQDKMISSYVEFVYLFMECNTYPMYVREVLNYLYYKEEGMDIPKYFGRWKDSLIKMIESNTEVGLEYKVESFLQMFNRFPELNLSLVEEVVSENKDVELLNTWIWKIIDDCQYDFQHDATFEKLMLTYYVLNLWSYYRDGVTAGNFHVDKYGAFLQYLELEGMDKQYNWLSGTGSIEKIKFADLSDVQLHLTELLEKAC